MLKNIEGLLTSLGYRPMDGDNWLIYGKPVGHHILLFDRNTNTLSNHFYDKQGKPGVYDLLRITGDTEEAVANNIKTFEAHAKFYIQPSPYDTVKHNFQFLTKQERIEMTFGL